MPLNAGYLGMDLSENPSSVGSLSVNNLAPDSMLVLSRVQLFKGSQTLT